MISFTSISSTTVYEAILKRDASEHEIILVRDKFFIDQNMKLECVRRNLDIYDLARRSSLIKNSFTYPSRIKFELNMHFLSGIIV